jgi:hypothetical protein
MIPALVEVVKSIRNVVVQSEINARHSYKNT